MPLDTDQRWAQRIDIAPGAKILASPKLWEGRFAMDYDAVGPDFISDIVKSATTNLLEKAAERGVAIDWTTLRTRFNDVDSENQVVFVVEANPL